MLVGPSRQLVAAREIGLEKLHIEAHKEQQITFVREPIAWLTNEYFAFPIATHSNMSVGNGRKANWLQLPTCYYLS